MSVFLSAELCFSGTALCKSLVHETRKVLCVDSTVVDIGISFRELGDKSREGIKEAAARRDVKALKIATERIEGTRCHQRLQDCIHEAEITGINQAACC